MEIGGVLDFGYWLNLQKETIFNKSNSTTTSMNISHHYCKLFLYSPLFNCESSPKLIIVYITHEYKQDLINIYWTYDYYVYKYVYVKEGIFHSFSDPGKLPPLTR